VKPASIAQQALPARLPAAWEKGRLVNTSKWRPAVVLEFRAEMIIP